MVLDGLRDGSSWLRLFPTLLPWLALLFGLWVRAGRHLEPRTRITGMIVFAAATVPLIVLPVREKHRWDDAAPLRALALAAVNAAFEWEIQERIRASEAAEREAGQPPLPTE